MGKGWVNLTNSYLAKALQFPGDWNILEIKAGRGTGLAELLIEGPDFPEPNNRGDAEGCQLVFHTTISRVRVEVNTEHKTDPRGCP